MNMPEELVPLPPLGPAPPELERLDEYLEDPSLDLPPARWSITNDGAAEWALRKLRQVQLELTQVDTQARLWHEEITLWAESRGAPLHRSAEFFRNHLELYGLARRELTAAPTVHLPAGKVATRAGKPRAVITSPELLVRVLKRFKRPDLVRVREDVLISTLLESLPHKFVRVPGVWKVGLDCGCVTLLHDPDDIPVCPECETVRPAVVQVDVEVPEVWELRVSINGKDDVLLPGIEVEGPVTSSTVTLR